MSILYSAFDSLVWYQKRYKRSDTPTLHVVETLVCHSNDWLISRISQQAQEPASKSIFRYLRLNEDT